MIGVSEFATLDALEEVERAGLIAGERFRHDLIRQSLYRVVPESRRKALHARAATALQGNADAMVVAHHWHEAGRLEQAIACWFEALDKLTTLGFFEAASSLCARIEHHAPNAETRHRTMLSSSWIARLELRFEAAEALVHRVLEETTSRSVRASAHAELAWLRFQNGRLAEAIDHHRQALEFGEGITDGFHLLGANIAFQMGDYPRALELLEPLEETRKPTLQCQMRSSRGAIFDAMGRNLDALQEHRQAIRIARDIGSKVTYLESVANLLWCLSSLGREAEGFEVAEEALSMETHLETVHLRNNLAAAYFDCGENERAIGHYEIIRRQSQYDLFVALANARLTELYHRVRNPMAAAQTLDAGLALLETVEYPVVRVRLVIATLKHGTREQIKRVEPFLEGLSSPDARTQRELEDLIQSHVRG
ncbi:MAG: tetratricopeptide repeat protein [Pleurocapsa sp. SU_196_0]|nr:tetratricopeptide repeat protein [Pleurocapsa sp. SU_196_0]